MKITESILYDDSYSVRPRNEHVPQSLQGLFIGDIFSKLARMNDGDDHTPLKSALVRTLMGFDALTIQQSVKKVVERTKLSVDSPEELSEAICALPILVVAFELGLKIDQPMLVSHIKALVTAIGSPQHNEIVRNGNESAQWLYRAVNDANGTLKIKFIEACYAQNIKDRMVINANLLGLFFQTMDGTSVLIGQMLLQSKAAPQDSMDDWMTHILDNSPPIKNTRRFINDEMVLLPLRAKKRSLPFGAGKHQCPGSIWAKIIAKEVVRLLRERPIKDEWLDHYYWKASPNACVPLFFTKKGD